VPDRSSRLPPPAVAAAVGAALIAQSALLRRAAGRDGRNATLWTLLGLVSLPGASLLYLLTRPRPRQRRRGLRRGR
jgi:hypothetical protein